MSRWEQFSDFIAPRGWHSWLRTYLWYVVVLFAIFVWVLHV